MEHFGSMPFSSTHLEGRHEIGPSAAHWLQLDGVRSAEFLDALNGRVEVEYADRLGRLADDGVDLNDVG